MIIIFLGEILLEKTEKVKVTTKKLEKWQILESKVLIETPWITVVSDRCVTQHGVEIPAYYWLDGNDYVVMVGTNTEGKLVMVEQYRHGIREIVEEFPAGLIDEGEEMIDAAKRELKEETGYIAEDIVFEKCWYSASAISNKKGYVFFARNMVETGYQELGHTEYINVKHITFEKLQEMVENGRINGGFAVATALWAIQKKDWFLGK